MVNERAADIQAVDNLCDSVAILDARRKSSYCAASSVRLTPSRFSDCLSPVGVASVLQCSLNRQFG